MENLNHLGRITMFKKIRIILLTVLVLALLATPSLANQNIEVYVDGEPVIFDQEPILENGRTLVPLRAIFEALGAKVGWEEESQAIFAKKRFTTISLEIDSKQMNVFNYIDYEDKQVILDVPAKLLNGRTLVPVRAISEALCAEVSWEEDINTVVIKSKQGLHKIHDYYRDEEFTYPDTDKVVLNLSYAYPQFVGEEGAFEYPEQAEVLNKLNQQFLDKANNFENGFEDDILKFAYEDYEFRGNDGYFFPHEYSHYFEVTYDNIELISILEQTYCYTGGAHGSTIQNANIYNLNTGEILGLSDILKGEPSEITALLQKTVLDEINSKEDYYWEDIASILQNMSLENWNFYLTQEGLVLYFQQYEIAPYATGLPSFVLPFAGNEDLFQEGIVL